MDIGDVVRIMVDDWTSGVALGLGSEGHTMYMPYGWNVMLGFLKRKPMIY